MDRRTFGKAIGGAAAGLGAYALASGRALGIPEGIEQRDAVSFPPGMPVKTLREVIEQEQRLTGNLPAYMAEVERAGAIISRAPSYARAPTTPFLVANYFFMLNEGQEGDAGDALYAREWPERANPIILTFFDATSLRTPNGDITPWCAAMVCYCLERARQGNPSAASMLASPRSAASKSFRTWGTSTDTPLVGDLVVFERADDPDRGHVGFFLTQTDQSVFVLGGNQRHAQNRTNGEVCVASYRKTGNLFLHSFRTDPSLHPQ
jgi:uncharacterized protein (TIGR02594 family)